MSNPFDQFDPQAGVSPVAFPAPPKMGDNPFDQFDQASADPSSPTPRFGERFGFVPPGVSMAESQPVPPVNRVRDVAESLVSGVVRGGIGLASLPGTTEQLYATAGERLGLQGVIPEPARKLAGAIADSGGLWGAPLRMISGGPTNKPTEENITGVVERVTGPLYQPQTVEGEYARTIGEFVPGGLSPGGIVRKATNVVVPAVASEFAGQATKGLSEENLARVAGGVTGALLTPLPHAIGTRLATPVRGYRNPMEFAAEKKAEAIMRDYPVGGLDRFAQRFEDMRGAQSGPWGEYIQRPDVRLMDAAGENVGWRMRAANNVPNDAREPTKRIVDTRQISQNKRITDNLSKSMGDGRNYFDSIDELATKMGEIGKTEIAPALKVETRMTPQLQAVLDRPTMKDLDAQVKRRLLDEGKPIGLETRTEQLHRMKVLLDDEIQDALIAKKMGNSRAVGYDFGTLSTLKRHLLDAIDNDPYKTALTKFASEAKLRNAARNGYDEFNTMQPEEIRNALKSLDTDAEREFYRLGAQRAIAEKVRRGDANNDRVKGVFSSPEMKLKLAEIMPDQKRLREFRKELEIERKMAESRRYLQGGPTTAKQLAEGDDAAKNASMANQAISAANGNIQAAANLLAQGWNRFTGMTPKVAAETLRLGMSRDPADIQRIVDAGARRAAQNSIPRLPLAFGGLPATIDRERNQSPRNLWQ